MKRFLRCSIFAMAVISTSGYLCAQLNPQQIFTVGAVENPCQNVEPLPAEVTAFMAKMVAAKKSGEPAPAPSAEGLARYQQYQLRVTLQDFPALCHYETPNHALAAATENRVIFMGDSITELWAGSDPTFFVHDRIDRGISGQTTQQMLLRFREDVIDQHPKVVHILAGINDLAGNTGPTSLARVEANLQSMVELAETHHIQVVLASLLPSNVIPWRAQIQPAENVTALNRWIKHYAASKNLIYVDYYEALKDDQQGMPKKYSTDGVHPTLEGYKVMEPLTLQALKKAGIHD